MSLYLVPKCDGCHRLFMQHGRPAKQGSDRALKERLEHYGWQDVHGCHFCPNCVRNHARGEKLDEPRRLAH